MARSRKQPFEPTADMRIVLLHGREPFLMRERSRELADALAARFGDVEEFRFEGNAVEPAALLDELRSYGLMCPHKLVVLDRADQFLTGQETRRRLLERYAEAPVDHATLLLRSETWRPGKLDKLIARVGLVHKVEPVDEHTAAKWCVRRCEKRHGAALEPAAAEALVALIGPELDRLDTELGKLASFAGPGAPIGHAEVVQMVGMSREQQAWAIQAALASGDPGRAVGTLRELLSISRQPEQLVTWAVTDLLRKLHAASRRLRQGVPAGVVAKELKLWGPGRDQVLSLAKAHDPTHPAQS